MAKIKVGVLRGGPSSEYDISLKTGKAVLETLDSSASCPAWTACRAVPVQGKYEPVDILIDKNGVWHLLGMSVSPEKCIRRVDVIFNALHGKYGEDGKVQKLFEIYKIPYTGSGVAASAVAMQKRLAREIFKLSGINTPPTLLVKKNHDYSLSAAEAIRQMGLPLVVKPSSCGSSVGVTIAQSVYDLILGIENAFLYDKDVLIEKYISGREATCAVLEGFRGERHYAFPVVEIVPPPKKSFFDYECKYDGSTQEVCPGRFDEETRNKIQKAAIAAHTSLDCRHYSRSDFIISPDKKVYILELNTLPGLTSESLVPKAAASVGLEFPQLLDHLISLALTTN